MTTRQLAKEIENRINFHIDGEERSNTYKVTTKVSKNDISVYPNENTFYCMDELVQIVSYHNKSIFVTLDGDNKLYAHIY